MTHWAICSQNSKVAYHLVQGPTNVSKYCLHDLKRREINQKSSSIEVINELNLPTGNQVGVHTLVWFILFLPPILLCSLQSLGCGELKALLMHMSVIWQSLGNAPKVFMRLPAVYHAWNQGKQHSQFPCWTFMWFRHLWKTHPRILN